MKSSYQTNKASHGSVNAFYIEALLLTLVVIVFLLLPLQLFAKAGELSKGASQTTEAVQIAQTVSAEFLSGQLNNGDKIIFNADGYKNDTGEYSAEIIVDSENTGAGTLLNGTVEITRIDSNNVVAVLPISRYDSNK